MDNLFLYLTLVGNAARQDATNPPPFGPGLETAERIDRLEIWCTGFDYQGDDYTEFRAFDANG